MVDERLPSFLAQNYGNQNERSVNSRTFLTDRTWSSSPRNWHFAGLFPRSALYTIEAVTDDPVANGPANLITPYTDTANVLMSAWAELLGAQSPIQAAIQKVCQYALKPCRRPDERSAGNVRVDDPPDQQRGYKPTAPPKA
jgi:hypothetical protein